MKKSQLKPLIKTVLREMYQRSLTEAGSAGTLEDYTIETDGITIPELIQPTDIVSIIINIEYDSSEGSTERGAFGAPEYASPAEDGEVSITDWDFVSVNIVSEGQEGKQIDDFTTISKEQFDTLKKIVNDYINTNEDDIKEKILNQSR